MSGRKSDHHRVAGLDVVMGILRLGCGQADGLGLFGDSVGHFTASLAPFIALPLVGSAIGLIDDAGIDIIGDLLAFWCSLLLAPAVLSWNSPANGAARGSGCATPRPSTGASGPSLSSRFFCWSR